MPKPECTGNGTNGDHCCYIRGVECPSLVLVEGTPRCSFMLNGASPGPGNSEWEELPVGKYFAVRWPGYGCADWPQNIPSDQLKNNRLCCYEGAL